MKAFLSHSSEDQALVMAVYNALEPQSTWLDRAEIEWGEEFLGRIAEGIETASDFVLFWSSSAAQSSWVRLELNMAFIVALKSKAIRLKVIRLDDTNLPLYLKPYQYLSVTDSANQVDDIVSKLRIALSQPIKAVRHRFVNRNSELERIEDMVNNPDVKVIFLHGFQGIGKAALANEAFRRFFEGASVTEIAVGFGMGPVELALQLHYKAFGTILPESTELEALAAIEEAMSTIIRRGQFLLLRDSQHWFDYGGQPEEPLTTVIRLAASLGETGSYPIFLTATRRPRIPVELGAPVTTVRVPDLADNHVTALICLWYEISEGEVLNVDTAARVAPNIHGHPIAAKLAANLVAQYGADHLLDYPKELIALRRDLAKTLIQDLSLAENTAALMETLTIIKAPVPQSVLIKALAVSDENFQDAVAEATLAGIAETDDAGHLTVHPLIEDYFWRSQLSHNDYRKKAETVAGAVHGYLSSLSMESETFVVLLTAVYRLYVLAGMLEEAHSIRRDLKGELASAAITHYNRRNYNLAETFIEHVLDEDPSNWKMRQYLARIHIRKQRWNDAEEIIEGLLSERPSDVASQHLRGWKMLRAKKYEYALQLFTEILSHRTDHVASLRDAADCLYRLGRSYEALEFLDRAKQIESNNPYTLELEARIYEEIGDYTSALTAAKIGVTRDPTRWAMRHRLARILGVLGFSQQAIEEVREAVRLDPAQFTSRSTLVSLLLHDGLLDEAEVNLKELKPLAADQHERNIAEHLTAQLLYKNGDLKPALNLIEGQIGRKVNLAANYGLLAEICLAQHSLAPNKNLASSKLYLKRAEVAIDNCEARDDHRPEVVKSLRERLSRLS